ncbi:MAG TPA: cytidylate kinase family protein [Candidatus Baltobacteraceae bacterium]|nr:cytidylate kinase family protein [Candidatus Baltobacteraceae bacterium]
MAIITISRGTYSGGSALAQQVAERLGYPCVSREVILEAAWASGMSAEEITAALEKRPSFWHRVMGQRTAYLTFVRAALCEHARDGRLVYHGHVGHLLLPGITHVLRVRATADQEFRIQAALPQHTTREAALAHIARVDRERREWSQFLFGVNWDDPLLYDLVLNLSRISLDTACEAVLRLAARPEFQPTPASAKALRDLVLQSRVAAALAADDRTRDAALTVTANDGRVTVTGTAHWPEGVEAVAPVARQVEGVTDLRCNVTFKSIPYAGEPVA